MAEHEGILLTGKTGRLRRYLSCDLSAAGGPQTTTWPSRHEDTFARFVQKLCEYRIKKPTVLEVGPGAVTKLLAPYYPVPNKGKQLPWLASRWRLLIRRMDSLLRRIPWIELCSFEPGELRSVLPADVKLHVADISPRVIAAIQKQYPGLRAFVHDFAHSPYPKNLDAIVCICVLVRANEPKKIFEHLYKSLKPGGLLVMDNRSIRSFGGPEFPLESLSCQLFRKPEGRGQRAEGRSRRVEKESLSADDRTPSKELPALCKSLPNG